MGSTAQDASVVEVGLTLVTLCSRNRALVVAPLAARETLCIALDRGRGKYSFSAPAETEHLPQGIVAAPSIYPTETGAIRPSKSNSLSALPA
jgi:hypothetical protein